MVANLTAKALRNAHRFERLQAARGTEPGPPAEREQAALIGFLRDLLSAFAPSRLATRGLASGRARRRSIGWSAWP